MKTSTHNTLELKDGDVVLAHGCLFRLRDRKVHPARNRMPREWEDNKDDADDSVITFATDLLLFDDYAGMPRHWADNWTIQGNRKAKWTVVLDSPLALAGPLAPYAPPPPPKRPAKTYWRVVTDAFSGDETIRRHGPKYDNFEDCAAAAERLGVRKPYAYADVQEYDAETDKIVSADAV